MKTRVVKVHGAVEVGGIGVERVLADKGGGVGGLIIGRAARTREWGM